MFHTILIKLPGCNEFTEKFPGGSPNDAKIIAQGRYPNAQRIEWKGTCRSDAEDAAAAKWQADYNQSVQDTYARQSAQTATTWQNQRELDARNNASSSTNNSGGGSSTGGLLIIGLCVIGAIFGGGSIDKEVPTQQHPVITIENCTRYLTTTECTRMFTVDRGEGAIAPGHRF